LNFGLLSVPSALGFLAAVAAIVTGLYLLRPPPQRLVLPSTLLWERVLARTRHASQRWRWWVSLLLSLAIALLAALALLQPGSGPTDATVRPRVIVIDDSPTMGALRADGRTRLGHAIDAARREIGEGEGTYLVLDTMRSLGPSGFTDGGRALARLAALEPAAGVEPRFPELAALPRTAMPPEVVFITDGVAPVAVPEGVRTVSVFQPVANVGITAFDVRALPADPSRVEAFVEVGNADTAAAKVAVRVSGAGHAPVTRTVNVPARGFASVTVPVSDFTGGALRATLDAGADGLLADDEAFGFLPFNRVLSVALVTAGNEPLERALRLDPRVRLTVLPPGQYGRRSGFDAYVFDRFAPPSVPAVPSLAFAPPAASWLPKAGASRETTKIADWRSDAPVLENVSLADIVIERARPFAMPADAQGALARTAEGAAIVVADDAAPRRVAVGFAVQDSNFAAQASFPVFLSNVVAWLASEAAPVHRAVGPVNLPLAEAKVRGLEAGPVDTRFVPGATLFTAKAPDFFTAESGGRRVRVLVNVLDPAVTDVNASRLAAAGDRAPDEAATSPASPRTAPWLVLLAMAAALMVAEWWTYHRRATI
jgi:hypothetical protein